MSTLYVAREAWFDAKLDLENEFGRSNDYGFSYSMIDVHEYEETEAGLKALYDDVYADSYYWNKVE